MSSKAVQDTETYWTPAGRHPWGVYIGPITGVGRRMRREMNGLLGGMLETGKDAGGRGDAAPNWECNGI
jgi:hypothetical protein